MFHHLPRHQHRNYVVIETYLVSSSKITAHFRDIKDNLVPTDQINNAAIIKGFSRSYSWCLYFNHENTRAVRK